MGKNINPAIERLLAKTKDWDFATMFFESKKPVLIERNSDIKRVDGSDTLVMNSLTLNPFPRNEQDAEREFEMQSYLHIDAIAAIDFYVEKRIQTAPVLSIIP